MMHGNDPIWQQKMCNLVVLVKGDGMSTRSVKDPHNNILHLFKTHPFGFLHEPLNILILQCYSKDNDNDYSEK